MAGVEEVEVVVAHSERATLRVGDVFLKIDSDQARVDVEVEAMAIAPIPTPVRVRSASIFRNTSPTRRVARSLWATTTSTSSTLAIVEG